MAVADWIRQRAITAGTTAFDRLPAPWAGTALIRLFGVFKIPLFGWIGPSVVALDEERCVVRVPLTWRTKNHLNVMYIGCIVAGADLAGGLMAMRAIQTSGKRVDLLFKDMKADFLKRVDGDAHFTCDVGPAIAEAVAHAVRSGERVNLPVPVRVTVPSRSPDRVVAELEMTLTLKRR